jgi:type IV secretory pathway VirB2 component (pilin)
MAITYSIDKGENVVNNERRFAIVTKSALSALTISLVLAEQAHAAAAGAGLPWEAPLQTITRSIQGPVAYGISLLSLIGCGGTLVWGGEINEFLRKGILLVLVISLIVFATNMMTTLFNTNGAVI